MLEAPILIPDTTNNYLDNILEISFSSNTSWESKINSILISTDGGVTFNPLNYDLSWVSPGKVTLPKGLPSGSLIFKFQAIGYKDAVVNQNVLEPLAEVRIKTKDTNIVQLDNTIGFITVKSTATVGEIKAAIESYNGSAQSYVFRKNIGDDNFDYTESDTISNIYVSWLDITSEDGSTKGQYIINFIE